MTSQKIYLTNSPRSIDGYTFSLIYEKCNNLSLLWLCCYFHVFSLSFLYVITSNYTLFVIEVFFITKTA
jgi:hypothetical protein